MRLSLGLRVLQPQPTPSSSCKGSAASGQSPRNPTAWIYRGCGAANAAGGGGARTTPRRRVLYEAQPGHFRPRMWNGTRAACMHVRSGGDWKLTGLIDLDAVLEHALLARAACIDSCAGAPQRALQQALHAVFASGRYHALACNTVQDCSETACRMPLWHNILWAIIEEHAPCLAPVPGEREYISGHCAQQGKARLVAVVAGNVGRPRSKVPWHRRGSHLWERQCAQALVT